MFCKYCGKQFEIWINPLFDIEENIGCKDCMQSSPEYNLRGPKQKVKDARSWYCVVCGEEIGRPSSARKHCENCERPHNPFPRAHTEATRRWQKQNKKKAKVSRLARYHAHKVQILYECPCDNGRKHKHHHDYDRPFEVILLCTRCHQAEHRRLNDLAALTSFM